VQHQDYSAPIWQRQEKWGHLCGYRKVCAFLGVPSFLLSVLCCPLSCLRAEFLVLWLEFLQEGGEGSAAVAEGELGLDV
jgi:hypothetical protein